MAAAVAERAAGSTGGAGIVAMMSAIVQAAAAAAAVVVVVVVVGWWDWWRWGGGIGGDADLRVKPKRGHHLRPHQPALCVGPSGRVTRPSAKSLVHAYITSCRPDDRDRARALA